MVKPGRVRTLIAAEHIEMVAANVPNHRHVPLARIWRPWKDDDSANPRFVQCHAVMPMQPGARHRAMSARDAGSAHAPIDKSRTPRVGLCPSASLFVYCGEVFENAWIVQDVPFGVVSQQSLAMGIDRPPARDAQLVIAGEEPGYFMQVLRRRIVGMHYRLAGLGSVWVVAIIS